MCLGPVFRAGRSRVRGSRRSTDRRDSSVHLSRHEDDGGGLLSSSEKSS